MNSQALESEIARGYHFPLEAIIFSPRLSFSPRGYHFPLEAIIFLSRLSFLPRGYHFPFEAIIFSSRRLSSKSRTLVFVCFSQKLETIKSNNSSSMFTFLLAFQLLQALGHPVLAQSPSPGVAVLPQVLAPRVRLLQKGDHPHSTPQQPLFVLLVLCSKAGSHLFKGESLARLGTLKSLFISLFAICYFFFAPDQVLFRVCCLLVFFFLFP